MNVYDFVASKDVAAYWQTINLQFTCAEACFLVWAYEGASYEEKCKAWQEAVQTMPDCEIARRPNCPYIPSLHAFLTQKLAAGDSEAIDDAFFGMWFYFPMPFRKGDIVTSKHGAFGRNEEGEVFVLYSLPAEDEKFRERKKKGGDSMDMIASGVFQWEWGMPYHEVMHRYFDIEYFRGELTGKRRLLQPVSALYRGEIDEVLAMQAYAIICKEEHIKHKTRYMNYTKEGLRLAGIGKE